jgi:AcrR family transcriptional regulator
MNANAHSHSQPPAEPTPPMPTAAPSPQQARSRDTQARILAALQALLAEKSVDAIGVQELATRAGVSVGGFYRRFATKEHALAHLLYEGYVTEAVEAADAALAPGRFEGAGTGEVVRAYLEMMESVGRRHLAVLRELVRRHRENPHEMAHSEASARFRERVHAPFLRLLSARADTFGHPDPALALRFAFSGVSSVMREALLFGHMQPAMGPLPEGALVAELTRMFCAYLGVPPPDAGPAPAPPPSTPPGRPRARAPASSPRGTPDAPKTRRTPPRRRSSSAAPRVRGR